MRRWSRILVLALLAPGADLRAASGDLMSTTSGSRLHAADSSGGIDLPAGRERRDLRVREDQTQIPSRIGRPADRALALRWGLGHWQPPRPSLAHPAAHPRGFLSHVFSPLLLPLRGGGGRSGSALVARHAAITAGGHGHVDEVRRSVGCGRTWAVIAQDGYDGALITHCLLRRCVPGYYFPHNVSGWVGGVWDGRPAPPCELCGATPMHRCLLFIKACSLSLPPSLPPSRLLSSRFAISLAHLSPRYTRTQTHTNTHTHHVSTCRCAVCGSSSALARHKFTKVSPTVISHSEYTRTLVFRNSSSGATTFLFTYQVSTGYPPLGHVSSIYSLPLVHSKICLGTDIREQNKQKSSGATTSDGHSTWLAFLCAECANCTRNAYETAQNLQIPQSLQAPGAHPQNSSKSEAEASSLPPVPVPGPPPPAPSATPAPLVPLKSGNVSR